ncbi:hypothetical protein MIND_00702900 [Mycena indigotica]|uniref:Peptidase S26 domain-containing protein n=1 Tax=Mycena indigotica TaxID=2126181 RepID=A0A8H6SNA2_9AGAR|nr:uncharacterized protein MIND_00702900 [Mycena indigotica]KAF7301377.1 hypothetical protein MIND_00702900 [Mycena indigotica]
MNVAPILSDTVHSLKPSLESIQRALLRLRPPPGSDRMFLHAAQVSFYRYKPAGSHRRFRLRIGAPLPDDFHQLCKEARIPLSDEDVKGGLAVLTDGEYQQVPNGRIGSVDGQWMQRFMDSKDGWPIQATEDVSLPRSEKPTLNPDSSLLWKDLGVFDRVFLLSNPIRRGDIVSLTSPYNPRVELIKRVIAVEGDTVRTSLGEQVVIPKGRIWVEGDGFHSQDSNAFGANGPGRRSPDVFTVAHLEIWVPERFYTEHIGRSSITRRI